MSGTDLKVIYFKNEVRFSLCYALSLYPAARLRLPGPCTENRRPEPQQRLINFWEDTRFLLQGYAPLIFRSRFAGPIYETVVPL
jgi:hypothetical protein